MLIVAIIGLVISIGLSLWLFWIGSDPVDSLIVGLLGTNISFVISAMWEATQTTSKAKRTVGLLSSAFRLSEKQFSSADQIVTALAQVQNGHSMFSSEAERRTILFSDEILRISQGYLSLHTNEKMPLLNAVKQTKSKIEATSLVGSDIPTWNTGSGRRYMEENEAAIKRGVSIRRTFIYREQNDDLLDLCKKLTDLGCRVFLIDEERLEPEMRVDIVIFDDSLLYESISDNYGNPLSNVFSVREADMTAKRRILDYINGISELWTP